MSVSADATPLPGKRGPKPRETQRVHVSVPGLLWEAVRVRWAEFGYRSFTPFAVELVCFDLRKRHPHTVTHPIAEEPRYVQDAIDRQIVAHYRPNRARDFALLNQLLQRRDEFEPDPAGAALPEVAAVSAHVKFPLRLMPLIERRWEELGYAGVAAYVTGLARYDLMLGGPHLYFSGKDNDPALLAKLDAMTEAAFRDNRKRRILLDYLIERALGCELTDEERREEMERLAYRLRISSPILKPAAKRKR